MASLLNGSLAASLASLPEVRLLVPALTYSWHLHGFPLEWEPSCFPGSSSRGKTSVPALTYSWHLHSLPLEWEPCCFPGSSPRGETTCPSTNLQLTFAWLPSSMGVLLLPWLLFQSWDYLSQPLLTVDIYMASLFFCTYHKGESVLNAEHLFVLKIFLLLSWVEGRQWIPSSNQTRDSTKELKGVANYLKVPKCEIFHPFVSRCFYTIRPLWICDFGTEIKNSKFFCFVKILFLRMLSVHRKKLFCVL